MYSNENFNEYEYDPFLGKWMRKRKERRANTPQIIARKERKAGKKGNRKQRPIKSRVYPKQVTPITSQKETLPEYLFPHQTITQQTVPIMSKKEAQVHKNANNAMQKELQTKQEDLKVQGMEQQIKQEEAKTEQINQQTKLAGTGKVGIWILGLVGGGILLKMMFGGNNNTPSAPAAKVA